MHYIYVVLAFIVLIKSADLLVDGAYAFALRLKMPPALVGLTVVAFGTSLPEFAISITSAFNGCNDISIGNIIGSNIMNVLLVLGLCGIIRPLNIQKSTMYIEIPFLIFISILLTILSISGKGLNWIDGLVLLGLFVVFLGYVFFSSHNNFEQVHCVQKVSIMVISIIAGVIGIWVSSREAIKMIMLICDQFQIAHRTVGLTVVSFATSLPELSTSLVALCKGKDEISVGNIVGSNIFNILFVLSITSLISFVPVDIKFIFDALISTLTVIILYVFIDKQKTITRFKALVLVFLYMLYIFYISNN